MGLLLSLIWDLVNNHFPMFLSYIFYFLGDFFYFVRGFLSSRYIEQYHEAVLL